MTVLPNARRVFRQMGSAALSGISGAGALGSLAPSGGSVLFDWGGTAHYTLKVLYPRPVDADPLIGLDADNRCFYAYPGLTYSITASAIGGVYPYLYELENEPSGMTINAFTGVITWTNPQSTASNIQVHVTDTKGLTTSSTWSITVGTSGWRFVDAVNGNDAWDGTTAAFVSGTTGPWQTLNKVYTSSGANTRMVFRQGTYTPAGIPTVDNTGFNLQVGEEKINWSEALRSVIWVAYPGEIPTLDYGYTGDGEPYDGVGESRPRITMSGAAIYMDGLTFYRSMTMAFQFETRVNHYGVQVRNCIFDTTGPGIGGGNSAFIMWEASNDVPSSGDIITGCAFSNIQFGSGNCALKIYGVREMLLHGNTFEGPMVGQAASGEGEAIVATKGSWLRDVTIRANDILDSDAGIGGNMTSQTPATLDICFNNISSPGHADGERGTITLGQAKFASGTNNPNGDIGPVLVQRNTLRGPIIVQELVTADGPYEFFNNVIVNADGAQTPFPYVQDSNISDASRMTLVASGSPTGDQNLAGNAAAAIVDGNGLLQGSYRTNYLGRWGHEVP